MLLSEYDSLVRINAGEWSQLDGMITSGGAGAWGLLFKVGIFIALCSFMIAGAIFYFKGDQAKEISENKSNVMLKFFLVIIFIGLVAAVTLFQTSFVLD